MTDRNHDEIKINRLMNEIRIWMNNRKWNADKAKGSILEPNQKFMNLIFFSRLRVDESEDTIVHKVKSLCIFVDL